MLKSLLNAFVHVCATCLGVCLNVSVLFSFLVNSTETNQRKDVYLHQYSL